MAKIYFRYGTMSSGKTLDLLKTYYNYKDRDLNTIIIKPKVDTKGGQSIISRNGSKVPVDYLAGKEDNIFEYISNLLLKKHIHCILVDEAQFLTKEQIDDLGDIADMLEIPVICYGLRVDFQDNLFEGSKRLFEIADSIEEMKTICMCGKKATMVVRYKNGKPVFDGDQVAIDGVGDITYESLCRKCKKMLEKSAKNKR